MSITGVETRSDFYPVPDGLLEIEHELPTILDVIARTARWVHPDTFKALPIWCPYTARGRPLYDAAWSVALKSGKGVAKVEQNIRAAAALRDALGVKSSSKPKNWTVCHIWGYDDDKFAGKSNVVQDPKYYLALEIWFGFQRRLRGSPMQFHTLRNAFGCVPSTCTVGYVSIQACKMVRQKYLLV